MIETILAPLDGSSLAEQGLSTACTLARETGATLLLLTATPFSLLSSSDDREQERIALRNRQRYLQKTRRSLESQGLIVRTLVLPGDAVSAILFAAEAERVGLICLATHGHSGLRHALLGSVAEAVARESTTPLLLTHPADQASPAADLPYQRILVALDGTPFAETALDFLKAQGLGKASELLLLRAVTSELAWPLQLGLTGNEAGVVYQEAQEQAERSRQEADAYLRALGAERLAGRTWTPMVALDRPAAAILEAARTSPADLIVLVTHARHGLDRLRHGSVAHDVLKHAKTPVLLLHGPAEMSKTSHADHAVPRSNPADEEGEPIVAGQIVHDTHS
jgi:nucleotide-binding universal stress UspA family protein